MTTLIHTPLPRLALLGCAILLSGSALLPVNACAQQRVAPKRPVAEPAAVSQQRWVTTWGVGPSSPTNNPDAYALVQPAASFTNQTIRCMCFASLGGSQVRVRLSNLYGATALNLGAVHVARRDSGANVVAGTDRALTFGGQTSISVPPGAVVQSDPVALTVPALSDLAVSIYLPDAAVPNLTSTPGSPKASYIALAGTGDMTAVTAFPTLGTMTNTTVGYIFLATDIEVLATGAPPSIVAFGDSITEGYHSTVDGNASWPDRLAVRLNSGSSGLPSAVADMGISGNRVLVDNFGPNALARFDRDVLAHPNLTHVTVLEGINDIGDANDAGPLTGLIQGYRQLIARAHDRGVKIIGCTLLPFKGATASATYYSADKDATRIALNDFIRNSAEFDGLIDFDRAMGSPGDPLTLNPAYDSGDHLHPNDAGYQAMANAVDLSLFNGFVTLNGVVSRKVHGNGAGTFDLPLPQGLCNPPAIEDRGGGANGAYTLIFSFATPIQSILGAALADGASGSVDSVVINPNEPTQVSVNLTGVASGQYVTVALTNVADLLGNTSSVRATFGVLVGDVGNNGTVNAADVAQAKSLSGQGVTASNFRADLNLDGVINAADVAFVKSQSGTSLPAPVPANVNP